MGMLFVQTNITSQALPFFMNDLKNNIKLSVWDSWIADWMAQNPKAESMEQCNDIISTQEILHTLFLQTGENSVSIDTIHTIMLQHDYIFESGGWLVV